MTKRKAEKDDSSSQAFALWGMREGATSSPWASSENGVIRRQPVKAWVGGGTPTGGDRNREGM